MMIAKCKEMSIVFKIGEFSKITQVSVRMLRYYDEQKLLQPSYVDEYTGYRLYSPEQIEQLNRIVFLRDMGFSVNAMKNMLCNWNSESIKQSLIMQLDTSRENIKKEEIRVKQLEGLLYDLDNQDKEVGIDIILKSLPMQQVISMRKTVPDYYCEGLMWKELQALFKDVRNTANIKSFSIYHDIDYREQDVDIEICVVTDRVDLTKCNKEIISRQVPAIEIAACFMIYGPYSNISKAYKEFAYWLDRHKEYSMQGENRQICHVSACDTDNPKDYITEMQIPLKVINN